MAIAEFLIFAPMLGTGGSYLAFLTGNLTNLKIPCAMNVRDIAKVETGTPENEIISTLSIFASAITTMLIIFVGVLLLTPLRPILEKPELAPAFDNVVAALFGALGLKYFIKQPKIAIGPLILMTLLCILVPSMISQTSILIIIILILCICLIRALALKPTPAKEAKISNEVDERALRYGSRLGNMIRCETISDYMDKDTSKFYQFHGVLKEMFPRIHKVCEKMDFNGNLLYRWKGIKGKGPVMLMSHMDVVEAGGNWEYKPFSRCDG